MSVFRPDRRDEVEAAQMREERTMTESTTPRTDAAEIDDSHFSDWGIGPSGYVAAEFARGLERELAAERHALADSVSRADAAERETEAIRTLMNAHNLGGWTDALAPMRRALAAEAEVKSVRDALDECDLIPHGSLADRIRMLDHHNREWKDMFAETSNRLYREAIPYAGLQKQTIEALVREVRDLIGLFDPYGRGRVNESEDECADRIARAKDLADGAEKTILEIGLTQPVNCHTNNG